MTLSLHQLRFRSRALAHGLLLVLLATWLAAACPHCLAQAAQVAPSEMDGHCHSDAPAPAQTPGGEQDSCPQSPICTGAGCAQLSSVADAESVALAVAEPELQSAVAAAVIAYAYPATPPPSAPVAPRVAADPCPIYLRHCSFLN